MQQKLTLRVNFWTADKDTNFHMFISYLYGFRSSKIWLISYFNSYVISTIMTSKWPALQLAQLAHWIERYVPSWQRPGFDSCSSLIFFSFFFFHFQPVFHSTARIMFTWSVLVNPFIPQLSVAIPSCLKFNIASVRGWDNLSYYYLVESQDIWRPL